MGKRRFWGSVRGMNATETTSSTEASRGGSNGIEAHARGWDLGIKVIGKINEDGEDEFEIWTTGGSHNPSIKTPIATVNPRAIVWHQDF
jgi:hypothetical protein